MTQHETGADFVANRYASGRALLASRRAISTCTEHDACGVGLVAALDGKPRREVVQAGIDALKAVWHRGAVDADGKTGDGAGIHVEIPQDFFARSMSRARGHQAAARAASRSAWCSCRAPTSARRNAAAASSRPRSCDSGYTIYGWRQVPVNVAVHRREGERDAPRDRADHDLRPPSGATSRRSSATSTSSAAASRSRRSRRRSPSFYICSLSLPLGDLQGHVPGRAA